MDILWNHDDRTSFFDKAKINQTLSSEYILLQNCREQGPDQNSIPTTHLHLLIDFKRN